MSTAEKVAAALVGFGVLVAIWQVLVTQANERRRTQPVVVTHEDTGRRFNRGQGGWVVLAHATNEGEGAAFNVRWGVSFYGIRFAYRLDEEDPYSGNRLRVIHPRGSIPPTDAWPIVISSIEIWGGDGVPEDSAYYWARYENAQGRTWETINSADRSKGLRIKRKRFIRLREWLEDRRRRQFKKQALQREQTMLAEFREKRDQ